MANIYIGNDMEISLSGPGKLTDKGGRAIVGASVKAYLNDSDTESEVGGVTWPITLSDKGSGEYSGVLPDSAEITEGDSYILEVTAEKDGAKATWRQIIKAEYRSFRR